MSEPITWPSDFIDHLILCEIRSAKNTQPRLTPDQAEALVSLLAKATRAGCLPSIPDVMRLLDLIEEGLRPLEEDACPGS